MANKTVPTDREVEAFLTTAAADRRSDADRLIALMSAAVGEPPVMWGSSIVGFGKYHYRYESGREGETCLVGFSPRKGEFSIYLTGIYFPESADRAAELLSRLGKHRMGKACLYVKKLSDVDEQVLRDLIELSVSELRRHYP